MLGEPADLVEQLEDPYLALAAWVIRSGLSDYGSLWAATPAGRFWCRVAGLDPDKVKQIAAVKTPVGYLDYLRGIA